MKKIIVILGCVAVLLSACGKDDSDKAKNNLSNEQVQKVNNNGTALNSELKKAKPSVDEIKEADEFFAKFDAFDAAQKYYFCAAFAMGAMSVVKPVTASAMVNYFMGLGVAKYNVGINDATYKAFNEGKNIFRNENLVNAILKRKVCENIMNEAADFARERNYHIADLDKRGKIEVEKVVSLIKQNKK